MEISRRMHTVTLTKYNLGNFDTATTFSHPRIVIFFYSRHSNMTLSSNVYFAIRIYYLKFTRQ